MLKKMISLFTSFLMAFATVPVYAQSNFFEIKEPPRAAEYIYRSSQKESLIGVQLLGAVKHPGLYYVPPNTDILKLLTLAGGIDEANLSEVIVRKVDPAQAGVGGRQLAGRPRAPPPKHRTARGSCLAPEPGSGRSRAAVPCRTYGRTHSRSSCLACVLRTAPEVAGRLRR